MIKVPYTCAEQMAERARAEQAALIERLRAAQALKAHREWLGLTQRDAAAALGVNASTIWNWEHGANDPPEDVCARLTATLPVQRLPSVAA